MRKPILVVFALLLLFQASAQNKLAESSRTSIYTYIYKISINEYKKLYDSEMDDFNEAYLYNLIDSFKSVRPAGLLNGNYLLVKADGGYLNAELYTQDNLKYKFVNNGRDLALLLHHFSGEIITTAIVSNGKNIIKYNNESKTYFLKGKHKIKKLLVVNNGTATYLPLTYNKQPFRIKYALSKLTHSFPVKYVADPLRRLIYDLKNRDRYVDRYREKGGFEKRHTGYMVFDKPKYRPNDTVRLKAFITKRRSGYVNKKLLVRLSDNYLGVDTILGYAKPYRPGGYVFEFLLSEKLEIDLDDRYMVTFELPRSKKYNLDTYEGDLDDEVYAQKRKILQRGFFEFEDYNLSAISFTARADKSEHSKGEPVSIYLKAVDENELAVPDGRVSINLLLRDNHRVQFFNPYQLLKDTLWKIHKQLEPIGETKITIPDSVLPAANFEYIIECEFLNSNNELKTTTLNQRFYGFGHSIKFKTENDSLYIFNLNGKDISCLAKLIIMSHKDTIQSQAIFLPAVLPINGFATNYIVICNEEEYTYTPSSTKGLVSFYAKRTPDSVFINSVNPSNLDFWYTVFAGNKIVERGYTRNLNYIHAAETKKKYTVSYQYIRKGQVINESQVAVYTKNQLELNLKQPEFIYPGQELSIELSVVDKKGTPVVNADITAWAYTSKFKDDAAPFVPYYGRSLKSVNKRKFYNPALKQPVETGEIQLNWKRWSQQMGLDTIEYYKFLYTDSIYRVDEIVVNHTTQFAPFIVNNGTIQPIHQIYLDERPLFFNQANHLFRYSFPTTSGYHSIRLRTNRSQVYLPRVLFKEGMKTILAINSDTTFNKSVHVLSMPDSLTNNEKEVWKKYMILLEDNLGESFGTLKAPGLFYLLQKAGSYDHTKFLTGPLPPGDITFKLHGKFTQQFNVTPNYSYLIKPQLVRQHTIGSYQTLFDSKLSRYFTKPNFSDYVLTEQEVDSLWNSYLDKKNARLALFTNVVLPKAGNGRLQIEIPALLQTDSQYVKSIFLFHQDDIDYLRIYRGGERNLGYIQPGIYRLFILFNTNGYILREKILVESGGINFYRLLVDEVKIADSVSERISRFLNTNTNPRRGYFESEDKDVIKEYFNEKFVSSNTFSNSIEGVVFNANHRIPIAGASVYVKGTKVGTTTNKDGYFYLKVPQRGTLIISSVGYNNSEKAIASSGYYEIKLYESSASLNEVIVTGYGVSKKREIVGSITSVSTGEQLMGKVSGVTIRGASALDVSNQPIVIVDGLPVSNGMMNIDTAMIGDIKIIKGSDAVAIYGQKGVNGIIIITTKKAMLAALPERVNTEPIQQESIRKNFKDIGFWQPMLKTGRDGNIRFKVKFPDDITKWKTQYIAMSKGKSGYIQSGIKSFRLVSANLLLPGFILEGDSINIIGKLMNYGGDTIVVDRNFVANETLMRTGKIKLSNSYIDTIPLFAVASNVSDSMTFKYTLEKNDGYYDGEERILPVYNTGFAETKGYFASLKTDTSFTIFPDSSSKAITIHAEAAMLPIFLNEIDAVKRYEYLCNEQAASKLKALLLKRKVNIQFNQTFKDERLVNELIRKLTTTKRYKHLWGWWEGTDALPWVSLHVLEALLKAEETGYSVTLNKQVIIDALLYNMEAGVNTDWLSCLAILQTLKAKVDYKKYTDTFEVLMNKQPIVLNSYLRLLEIKQKAGLPIAVDSLLKISKSTVFGNTYWGEQNYRFFDNSIQNTLLAYRILRANGNYADLLKSVRFYFMEQRKDGNWRNTYESSLILETIMPDIIRAETESGTAVVKINGSEIEKFPYTNVFIGKDSIIVSKLGELPVYFTAYSKQWSKKSDKADNNFIVKTSFVKERKKIDTLVAGSPFEMQVSVSVKADADYVMIEIPIPASCTYVDKQRSYRYGEIYREYFKNKVSIFCGTLKQGEYTFSVSLLPRFTGRFSVNPAVAAMMYFPVFNGRESLKKVIIQ